MAFTTINLTQPVAKEELAAYGAKAGQHDNFRDGIAVFAVNTGAASISAGTVYITATGELKSSSASGYLTGKTLAACPAGDGIYVIVQGIVPGSTPAYIAYTIAS